MSLEKTRSSRREFLVHGTQAAAGMMAVGALASRAAPAPSSKAQSGVMGANDRINIAVIGTRSRGMQLARGFVKIPGVHIRTLVDVDENLLPDRVKELESLQGAAPKTEHDLRRVFEDKSIDAVVVATPDHWHALATIWACQAGKHVYVEKPCCHNLWEGRRMVEAARKHNRLVAVGFQNRSIGNVRAAMRFLHEGGLGDVYMARGLCFKPRDSIGHASDGPTPPGVHYDLWLGPAPKRAFNRNHFHYEWHWNWTYGAGDIGNQGPHQFDVARWGLNKPEHPRYITSSGGYFKWHSDQETPNTQTATFEYADGKMLVFEVRGLYTGDEDSIRIGNLFYGTEGWMHLNGSNWKTYLGRKNEPGPSSEQADDYADPMDLAGVGGGGHFANFIYALRADDRGKLTSDIESGFMSTALPHLANIAWRARQYLTFDGEKERFVGDAATAANELLRREYREPYVVPAAV